MRSLLLLSLVAFSTGALRAAEFSGVIVDSSGKPVAGAQVAVFTPAGILTEQIANDKGVFDIYVSPLYENLQLRVTAPGFLTATVGMGASQIQLTPAAHTSGSAQQGSSVSTVTSGDLRERNEAQAFELLRETPGVLLEQAGAQGAYTRLLVRGGGPKDNLVLFNGIPVNGFYSGGAFDFASVLSDSIEQIDVARGPQSALYGSYAMTGVVSLVTRAPQNGAAFDALAEGGTHDENRVALGGSGMPARDFGLAGSLSSLHENGPVPNSDYRDDNAFFSASYRWRTQNLFVFGDLDSNARGEPGPFGADLTARNKNDAATYGLHWKDDFTDNLRADLLAGFYRNKSLFISPDSSNNDERAYGDARLTYAVNKTWSMAGGYSFSREETRDSSLIDTGGNEFLLRRDSSGAYWENRVSVSKLYLNVDLREEIFQTPAIPLPPLLPAHTDTRFDLKVAGAYSLDRATRIHASYGTGIRPPGGMELAVNPALRPERTIGYDIGAERSFLTNRLSLDATWFHDRFKDPIAPRLSQFAAGVEGSARLRLAGWFFVIGNYMWLESEALALRPLKQSGSMVATFHYRRMDSNVIGYFGYRNIGLNVNIRVKGNLAVYGNLRNALDERYEEIYGYPNPLLNVVAGVKWNLARAR